MHDQASLLREMVRTRPTLDPPVSKGRGQIVAVTSGKGGVGKTSVVINLSIALQRDGHRVVILDADFGLANVDVLLGLTPEFHLGHVVQGSVELPDIVIEGPEGVHIMPASSGLQELADLSPKQRERILSQLTGVLSSYDYVLIDTAAGISKNVLDLLFFSGRVIVVSEPEPTAIVDAYALMKVLFRRDHNKEILILINSAASQKEAEEVFQQLNKVVRQFLPGQISLLGFVPHDDKVRVAVRRQSPIMVSFPKTETSRCFKKIAERLVGCSLEERVTNLN